MNEQMICLCFTMSAVLLLAGISLNSEIKTGLSVSNGDSLYCAGFDLFTHLKRPLGEHEVCTNRPLHAFSRLQSGSAPVRDLSTE